MSDCKNATELCLKCSVLEMIKPFRFTPCSNELRNCKCYCVLVRQWQKVRRKRVFLKLLNILIDALCSELFAKKVIF